MFQKIMKIKKIIVTNRLVENIIFKLVDNKNIAAQLKLATRHVGVVEVPNKMSGHQ